VAGFAGDIEQPDARAIRAATFVLVGGLTGYLFDHARHAMLGWRSAAVEVALRQRDGMVALVRGAEAKDTDTGGHVVRVQLLAEELARATGLDPKRAADIGWSAILHDVGKLHVPDPILLKPGALSADEWAITPRHPVWGRRDTGQGDGFEVARRIARWHHENIDGSGYPDGLRGKRIPLQARIVRIADAFDAMTRPRPYQVARSVGVGPRGAGSLAHRLAKRSPASMTRHGSFSVRPRGLHDARDEPGIREIPCGTREHEAHRVGQVGAPRHRNLGRRGIEMGHGIMVAVLCVRSTWNRCIPDRSRFAGILRD